MTIPYFTHEKLIAFLDSHSWKIVSDTDWETHNRLMIGKDGISFPLPIKPYYPFSFVVELCQSLEIVPPEDHLKCYQQYKEYKAKNKKNPPIEKDVPKDSKESEGGS